MDQKHDFGWMLTHPGAEKSLFEAILEGGNRNYANGNFWTFEEFKQAIKKESPKAKIVRYREWKKGILQFGFGPWKKGK